MAGAASRSSERACAVWLAHLDRADTVALRRQLLAARPAVEACCRGVHERVWRAWANRRVNRVNRGGYWYNTARYCRAASRSWLEPTFVYDDVGFRLSRSL